MKKFRRKSGAVVTHLSSYEVELLSSLVSQLVEMISDGEPEAFGSRRRTTRSSCGPRTWPATPTSPRPHEDPVLQRLFPDAYPHDARGLVGLPPVHRARAEDQEDRRRAGVVLDRLAGTDAAPAELRIPAEEVERGCAP